MDSRSQQTTSQCHFGQKTQSQSPSRQRVYHMPGRFVNTKSHSKQICNRTRHFSNKLSQQPGINPGLLQSNLRRQREFATPTTGQTYQYTRHKEALFRINIGHRFSKNQRGHNQCQRQFSHLYARRNGSYSTMRQANP